MITIEVAAEDGTTKKYYINATRLSSSDASLANITLSCGILSPPFESSHTQYSVTVPYNIASLEVKPIVADKATSAIIDKSPEAKPVDLNYGETTIHIEVTSPDKTNTKVHELYVTRMEIPWPVCLVDAKNFYNYSCPICLGVFHCPKSIAGTKPKHVFCKCCINKMTKTTKRNPLNELLLTGKWQLDEEILEQELSAVMVSCVYSRYGCLENQKLKQLGPHMKQCQHRLCFVDKSEELSPNNELESKMKVTL